MKQAYFALFLMLFLGISVGHAAAQSGGDYEIKSHTIDGGGSVDAGGGAYQLKGTVGQADTGIVSGGDFTLSQGFWQIEDNSITTSVHFNTANSRGNHTMLLFIALMVAGAVLLTIQLRSRRL